MNILVLNGSPRPNGSTAGMIKTFKTEAESAGHTVNTVDVCRKNIHGCLACEYCHGKGDGECSQKDDMSETLIVYLMSKHLSLTDRAIIEKCLAQDKRFCRSITMI